MNKRKVYKLDTKKYFVDRKKKDKYLLVVAVILSAAYSVFVQVSTYVPAPNSNFIEHGFEILLNFILFFLIPFFILAFFPAIFLLISRRGKDKQLSNYNFVLGDGYMIWRIEEEPIIRINKRDINKIIINKKSITVQSYLFNKYIKIPKYLHGYDEVITNLSAWKQPISRSIVFLEYSKTVLPLVIFFLIFIYGKSWLFIFGALGFFLFMTLQIRKIHKSKEINNLQKNLWSIFLLIVTILITSYRLAIQ